MLFLNVPSPSFLSLLLSLSLPMRPIAQCILRQSDDEDEEDLPYEAKLRMRNLGRCEGATHNTMSGAAPFSLLSVLCSGAERRCAIALYAAAADARPMGKTCLSFSFPSLAFSSRRRRAHVPTLSLSLFPSLFPICSQTPTSAGPNSFSKGRRGFQDPRARKWDDDDEAKKGEAKSQPKARAGFQSTFQ